MTRESFLIMAEVPKGKSLDDVRDTMLSVLERVGEEGVTAEEVERAQAAAPEATRPGGGRPEPDRHRAQRVGRAGRLAALFPRPRPDRARSPPSRSRRSPATTCRPSNRTIGLFIPTDKAERTPVPATPDLAAMVDELQGPRHRLGRRVVRRGAGASRRGSSGPSRSKGSRSRSCPRRPGTRPSSSISTCATATPRT